MTETWKPMVGTNGHYDISSEGRVRSWKNLYTYRGTIAEPEGFHIMACGNYYGYPQVIIRVNKETVARYVHLAVLEAFDGPRPMAGTERYFAVHLDGNKKNNHYSNLKWMTPSERNEYWRKNNIIRKVGTMAILNEAEVVEIRQRLADGERAAVVAQAFDISLDSIYRIWRGETWKGVGVESSPTQNKRLTKEQGEEAMLAIENGETLKVVAARYGVEFSTISRRFKRTHGISLSEYKKYAQ